MGDNMDGKGDGRTDQKSVNQLFKAKFLQHNYRRLPWLEQLFFKRGSLLISANSAACGLMAYNLFRETLKIRKHYFSVWAVTTTPFLLSHFLYDRTVTYPLLEGTLMCPMCAMIRSGLIVVGVGCVVPVYLSSVLTMYSVPRGSANKTKRGLLHEIISLTRPVFKRLQYFFLFEVIAGTFVTSRQTNTIEKMLLMPPFSETED